MMTPYAPGQAELIGRLREHCDSDMTAAADGLEAKDAEIERLNRCLQLEQHRLERIGTHGPGCWAWGPGHWECAMREIGRLRSPGPLAKEVMLLVDSYADIAVVNGIRSGWAQMARESVQAKLIEQFPPIESAPS